MELWIRSQNKSNLILAKDIVASETCIKVYKETELCTTVATYKTKERALEVLDEIKSCLETNSLFNLYSNIGAIPTDFNQKWNYVAVYQMPKE